jgi:hypothetical protein
MLPRNFKSLIFALGLLLSVGLVGKASAQIFVSTGTNSGLRMYAPGVADWWLNPQSGNLNFVLAGSASAPIVAFSSAGFVGIGTSNPADPLEVAGANADIRISGLSKWGLDATGSSVFMIIDWTDSIRRGIFDTSGDVYLGGGIGNDSGSGAVLSLLGGGNVGIGTTMPQDPLDIWGTGIMRLSQSAGRSTIDGFDAGTQTDSWYLTSASYGLFSGNSLGLGTGGTIPIQLGAGSISVTISTAGSVGIGTAGPLGVLDVRGESASPYDTNADFIDSASTAPDADTFFEVKTLAYSSNSPIYLFKDASSGQQSTQRLFEVQSKAAGTVLTTLAGGNVGIGTTSPSVKLNVAGGSASGFETDLLIRAGADADNSGAALALLQSANSRGLVIEAGRQVGDTIASYFILNGNGNAYPSATFITAMTLLQNGHSANVGIGTTAPGATLDVSGNMSMENGSTKMQTYLFPFTLTNLPAGNSFSVAVSGTRGHQSVYEVVFSGYFNGGYYQSNKYAIAGGTYDGPQFTGGAGAAPTLLYSIGNTGNDISLATTLVDNNDFTMTFTNNFSGYSGTNYMYSIICAVTVYDPSGGITLSKSGTW